MEHTDEDVHWAGRALTEKKKTNSMPCYCRNLFILQAAVEKFSPYSSCSRRGSVFLPDSSGSTVRRTRILLLTLLVIDWKIVGQTLNIIELWFLYQQIEKKNIQLLKLIYKLKKIQKFPEQGWACEKDLINDSYFYYPFCCVYQLWDSSFQHLQLYSFV